LKLQYAKSLTMTYQQQPWNVHAPTVSSLTKSLDIKSKSNHNICR